MAGEDTFIHILHKLHATAARVAPRAACVQIQAVTSTAGAAVSTETVGNLGTM